MQELELKFLLGKEAFYQQMEAFARQYPHIALRHRMQINYYYDTKDLLFHQKWVTLRIRQTEGGLVWQEKAHTYADFAISEETERPIETIPQEIVHQGQPVLLQGHLATHRTQFRLCDGLKIEWDRNFYCGICDYEVEIEFDEGMEKDAQKLAEKFCFGGHNQQGKARRFYERIYSR